MNEQGDTRIFSALPWVPAFARGYVKDLRVRWALEEAGLPGRAVTVDSRTRASEDYRRWQPFGQVPAYRDGPFEIFESAAIVLHLAGRSERLAPADPAGAARVTSWVLAAVTTLQPRIDIANSLSQLLPDRAAREEAARLDDRLASIETWLVNRKWLEDRFTAGDLVMASIVREIEPDRLQALPALTAWLARCLGRPAFQTALAQQFADFVENI